MRRLLALVMSTACSTVDPTTPQSVLPTPATPTPGNPPPAPTPAESRAPTEISNISISTGDLIPAFDKGTFEYAVTSLTTLESFTITVSGEDATIDGAQAKDGVPFTTTVKALDDTTTITIAAKAIDGETMSYIIHTAPPTRPKYTVTVLDPAPGNIYLSPFANNHLPYLYELDANGALVFYRRLDQTAYDFKKVTYGGKTRYTYIQLDGKKTITGALSAAAWVLDEHMRPMFSTSVLASKDHSAFPADVHEFQLLEDDHWIVQAYYPETVQNVPNVPNALVYAGVVQEVKGGQVIFDWRTTTVPEFYAASTEGNAFSPSAYSDYAHMNSMALDPSNGNFLLSFRHLDEMVELDRNTGAVVWTLGGKDDGFGLLSSEKSSHQHYARFVEPGRVIAFDNGNIDGVTKIREWVIDPQSGTAKTTTTTVDNHYTYAMGSVQKLGSKYFIGWGFRNTGASDITEIDSITHEKSFELTLETPYSSYRAQKLE